MDDEDISERKLKIASILDRLKSFTSKYGNEENWTDELTFTKSSADTTEHSGVFNHLLTPKSPEEWLDSLLKLEKTGLPQRDHVLLNKLLDSYSQAVVTLPAEKHSHNESYAKILVHFAELKAILDPDEARVQFQIARLNCKKIAFVHAAFAQFENSEGNFKKSKQILLRAKDCGADPAEMITLAMKNLELRKSQLISEEDEDNLSACHSQHKGDSAMGSVLGKPQRVRSDSSGELSINMRFLFGDKVSSPEDRDELPRKPLTSVSNKACQPRRVPIPPVTSPDSGTSHYEAFSISSVKRQPLSALRVPVAASLSKPRSKEDDGLHSSGNKVAHNLSPTCLQQLTEDSVEMSTPSSVIIRRTNVTLKGDEDVNMDETDSTTAPYNPVNTEKELDPPSDHKQPNPLKPSTSEMEWKWKVPEKPSDVFQGEVKRMSIDPSVFPARRVTPPVAVPMCDPVLLCRTPAKPQEDFMNCFRTPVVKNPLSSFSTPCNGLPIYQLPHTPASSILPHSTFPSTQSVASNDCIVVKRRTYVVLKQIGTGGSSKVFQVMDEKKQLYAIKYVNLEEADQQTIESYQNEISHLNKLQQHSDKIIRLYDYEITAQHIYMVMECGNLDLNTWLRKKKTVNPWERKSYWKNMLEAVHTIHQHGIVHSDLKPANFLIVDGMLKLIDFGIANQIQPDVTSIVKDSQVGTINYMPPEAIKDTSFGENGRPRSKISPKGDVWSLGCILYCMTYGKTPFQHITNQITKLHAILNPDYEIEIPDIPEKDLQDVLRKCLVRNPKERISIAELLVHPYVQIQPHPRRDEVQKDAAEEMKRVLGTLIGLNSPNSISRAAKNLYEQCSRGKSLDLSSIGK